MAQETVSQESDRQTTPQTQWHRLLGALLEELLTPVGITVMTGFPIMSNPPEADILLLRREGGTQWTAEQYARLPDGIRHSAAAHILLEFKYTESVNLAALQQAVGYDSFYRRNNQLTEQEVQTFLLSSRQPNGRFLETFGYQTSEWTGVYTSQNPMLSRLPILSLNTLSAAEHNAYIKCFASRKKEKQRAFNALQTEQQSTWSPNIYWLLLNLWRHWFKPQEGESDMTIQLSPEDMKEMADMWGDSLLAILPPEKLLTRLTPEERLAGLDPEERLAGLDPEERLAGLTPEDLAKIEAYLLQQKQQRDNK